MAEDEEFRQKYLRASTKEPNHPRTRYCPVTGQPAKYRDPATGTPYATIEAFEQIREKYFTFPFKTNATVGQETHIEARLDGIDIDRGNALFSEVK